MTPAITSFFEEMLRTLFTVHSHVRLPKKPEVQSRTRDACEGAYMQKFLSANEDDSSFECVKSQMGPKLKSSATIKMFILRYVVHTSLLSIADFCHNIYLKV
jgi:hypothetical protein